MKSLEACKTDEVVTELEHEGVRVTVTSWKEGWAQDGNNPTTMESFITVIRAKAHCIFSKEFLVSLRDRLHGDMLNFSNSDVWVTFELPTPATE